MPYIPQSKRDYFDPQIIIEGDLTHPGTLNYLTTSLIKKFVQSRGGEWTEEDLDDAYGMLLCCLLELDRRKGREPKGSVKPPKEHSYSAYNRFVGNNIRHDIWRAKNRQQGASLDINFAGLLRYYHNVIAPYEESKLIENGEVYD